MTDAETIKKLEREIIRLRDCLRGQEQVAEDLRAELKEYQSEPDLRNCPRCKRRAFKRHADSEYTWEGCVHCGYQPLPTKLIHLPAQPKGNGV